MKTCCCSRGVSRDLNPSGPPWQRLRWVAGWIVPSMILAAMPKCSVCVAAYVALFTGWGISLAAAGAARWLVVIGCLFALAYLAARWLIDGLQRRSADAAVAARDRH